MRKRFLSRWSSIDRLITADGLANCMFNAGGADARDFVANRISRNQGALMPDIFVIAGALADAAASLRAEAALYPPGVRIWMAVMAATFFAGIVFTPWWREARLVVLVMLATAVALIVTKALLPKLGRATAGAVIHIVLWLPLLAVLLRSPSSIRQHFASRQPVRIAFGTWLVLTLVLLTASLLMDIAIALRSTITSL
jgi:hypothetical protein